MTCVVDGDPPNAADQFAALRAALAQGLAVAAADRLAEGGVIDAAKRAAAE